MAKQTMDVLAKSRAVSCEAVNRIQELLLEAREEVDARRAGKVKEIEKEILEAVKGLRRAQV